MATGIVKTFESYARKNVTTINGINVQGYVRLYASFKMTQTYSEGSGKSTLTFSDLKIKHSSERGYNLGALTSFVFGNIGVTVNGTTYTVFADTDGDDTQPSYRASISKSDVYATVQDVEKGAAWSYSLEVDHIADGSLTVDVAWSGITLEYGWDGAAIYVSGSETVALTKNPLAYALAVSAGKGATITVTRSGSVLADGAAIYHGDVLSVSFAALTGYKLTSTAVNGAASSGGSITVSGDVTIAAAAAVLAFSLSIQTAAKATATVTRTSSPLQGAATGALSHGSTVYYGDVLELAFTAPVGYKASATIDGAAVESGATHTVAKAVAIVVAAKAQGFISVGGSAAYESYQPMVGGDSAYEAYIAKIT